MPKKEDYFNEVFEAGYDTHCELKVPDRPPKFLDKKLFLEGQKFFWDHVLVYFFVLCQNLTLGLSVPNLW